MKTIEQLIFEDMTKEEIKKLADAYYIGNANWLNKEQEQDTKVGWRQGYAYAMHQLVLPFLK